MSGNRANASAIQRRTNSVQQTSPNIGSKSQIKSGFSPQQQQNQYIPQQQQNQYIPQQQQYTSPKNQYTSNPPPPNPKLSVSDAIALTTIRLGRVETFINNLPPLDHIEQLANSLHPENNENMSILLVSINAISEGEELIYNYNSLLVCR